MSKRTYWHDDDLLRYDDLRAVWRAFDEVWAGLDRIAQSKFTMAPQGDGFAEGYEAGLREARGIALVAMADAYRAFGKDPDMLPNGMVRLGGARLEVAQVIEAALAAATPDDAAPKDEP